MLNNRIYCGEVPHKGKWYAGSHEAIIDEELWSRAAETLANNRHERQERLPRAGRSLLAGRLFDPDGRQPASLTVSKLNTLTKLPMCWHEQKAMLGVR